MAKKSNQNRSKNVQNPNRPQRNEFLKSHPFAYIIVAIIAFVLGNYVFDLIAQLF